MKARLHFFIFLVVIITLAYALQSRNKNLICQKDYHISNGGNDRVKLYQTVEDTSTSSKMNFESGTSIKAGDIWSSIMKDQSPLGISVKSMDVAVFPTQQVPEIGAWKTLIHNKVSGPPGSLASYFAGTYSLIGEHESRVMDLWKMVRNRGSIRHLDEADNVKLIEAIKICYIVLWGRKTVRSLEDASSHARGIASILGEIKAPVDVVLSGILHEVVAVLQTTNDQANVLELEKRFGPEVIRLAHEYNQLPKFLAKTAKYTFLQSQAQLEMLISMMGNYYCLHIRLADRVHTMRELKNLPLDDHERRKIAEESRYVYAPLAHKMNLMAVKDELEDLSLKYLEPDIFLQCRNTQTAANKAYQEAYEKIRHIVEEDPELSKYKDRIKITYRIKGKYQLYQKMLRKNLHSPKQVRDALGIRLIVNPLRKKGEEEETYRTRCHTLCYTLMHHIRNMTDWEGNEKDLKDYILHPKENGYQSIHQYIKRKGLDTMIEVQVRTREMHLQAEFGAAAHWSYKDQIFRPEIATSKLYRWTWRSQPQLAATQAMEVIRLAQQYLNQHRVFVFLEDKSEVLNLKRSATALDAAFLLHSDLGLAAERIFVDGRMVSKNTPLVDGQVISVKTSTQLPLSAQVEGLTSVRTSHAKQAIRRHLRENHPDAVTCLGIVQFMLFLSFNQNVIDARIQESHNPNRIADIWQLQKWIKVRMGKTMDAFLQELGLMHSKDEFRKLMAGVLDIKPSKLRATTAIDIGLLWVRIQVLMQDSAAAQDLDHSSSRGHEYNMLKEHVLDPLLDELLPSLGYANMRAEWSELMGMKQQPQPPQQQQDEYDSLAVEHDVSSAATLSPEFPMNWKPSSHIYHRRQQHRQQPRRFKYKIIRKSRPDNSRDISSLGEENLSLLPQFQHMANDGTKNPKEYHSHDTEEFDFLLSATNTNSDTVESDSLLAPNASTALATDVTTLALRWQRMGKLSYAAKLLERHLTMQA